MQFPSEQDPDLSTEPFSTIRLRDGRTIAYLEVGSADGFPIFHFHGHGSSRLEVRLLAEKAADFGIRLIGLSRNVNRFFPGASISAPFGSGFQPEAVHESAGVLEWSILSSVGRDCACTEPVAQSGPAVFRIR